MSRQRTENSILKLTQLFVLFAIVFSLFFVTVNYVYAASPLLPIGGTYPGLRPVELVPSGMVATGAAGVVNIIQKGIYVKAKALIAPIIVFMIAGFGVMFIIAGGEEEKYKSAQSHFFYLLVGLLFIFLADFL